MEELSNIPGSVPTEGGPSSKPEKKGTAGKKRASDVAIGSVVEWFDALDAVLGANKGVKMKQLLALLTDHPTILLGDEERIKLHAMLKRLDEEERSRLLLNLKVWVVTGKDAPHHVKMLASKLQAEQPVAIPTEKLREPDALFDWMEELYFAIYSSPNSPKLDDLFVFARSVLVHLLDEENRPYLSDASVQIIHFVAKAYNPAKEGKLPAHKGKKRISDPEETVLQTSKLMLDVLDVKSDASALQQIVSIIRSLELQTATAKQEYVELEKRRRQLKEKLDQLRSDNQKTQMELYDAKQEVARLTLGFREKEAMLAEIQREKEDEAIRNEKKEVNIVNKMNDERNILLANLKKDIRYELGEMEEVLSNSKDEENKKFVQYYISQIRNLLS